MAKAPEQATSLLSGLLFFFFYILIKNLSILKISNVNQFIPRPGLTFKMLLWIIIYISFYYVAVKVGIKLEIK